LLDALALKPPRNTFDLVALDNELVFVSACPNPELFLELGEQFIRARLNALNERHGLSAATLLRVANHDLCGEGQFLRHNRYLGFDGLRLGRRLKTFGLQQVRKTRHSAYL
jgi:hypothetical protein